MDEASAWIKERQEAIAVLRRICERDGDNDWADGLPLARILAERPEKYLDAAFR